MGSAWAGFARAAAINRHPGVSLCPRRLAPATGTWGRAGARGCQRGDGWGGSRRRRRACRPAASRRRAGWHRLPRARVGDQPRVAQCLGRLPGGAVELAAGVRCAVGAEPGDFEGPAVVQVTGDRAADDGHAADAVAAGQRDRDGELRPLNRPVVAVVLRRHWHSARTPAAGAAMARTVACPCASVAAEAGDRLLGCIEQVALIGSEARQVGVARAIGAEPGAAGLARQVQ